MSSIKISKYFMKFNFLINLDAMEKSIVHQVMMKEIAQEVAQPLNLNASRMTSVFQKSGSVMAMQIVLMEVMKRIALIERALL